MDSGENKNLQSHHDIVANHSVGSNFGVLSDLRPVSDFNCHSVAKIGTALDDDIIPALPEYSFAQPPSEQHGLVSARHRSGWQLAGDQIIED